MIRWRILLDITANDKQGHPVDRWHSIALFAPFIYERDAKDCAAALDLVLQAATNPESSMKLRVINSKECPEHF
jgi:hypothetical protein